MKEFIKKIFSPARPNTPKVVMNGFKAKFKNAKNAEWSQRGQHWEVLFHWEKLETIAIFNESGELVEQRVNINIDTLPPLVSKAANKLGEVMNAIKINGGATIGYEIIHRDAALVRYVALLTEEGVLVSNNKL